MAIVTIIVNIYTIQKKKFLAVVICVAEITRAICNLYYGFLQLRNQILQKMSKPPYFSHENSWSFYPNMITPSFEHTVHSHSRMLDSERGLEVI